MTSILQVREDQIAESVLILQRLSARSVESVVLWFASRNEQGPEVRTVFVPQQETGIDYFIIPAAGISEVLAKCRTDQVFVAAQLHTHPFGAFHSEADDDLALIRHENALSFVLPNFGKDVQAQAFSSNAELFRLTRDSQWCHVPRSEHRRYYQII